jgi:Tol biopolymer transport system component
MFKPIRYAWGIICLLILSLAACGSPSKSLPHPAQFLFSADLNGKSAIYSMNADGSGKIALTDGKNNDSNPLWSPDGMKIAFLSDRDGHPEIYLMAPDGSGQTRLTTDGLQKFWLRWSPDGQQIAFQDANSYPVDVYAVNLPAPGAQAQVNGAPLVKLVSQAGNVQFTTWSPDSQYLAFIQGLTDAGTLAIVKRDGSGLKDLTDTPSIIRAFYFSPDSHSLLFSSASLAGKVDDQIYIMKVDGSGLTQLTRPPGRNLPSSWLPNGKAFIFTSDREGSPQSYRMNADGSNLVKLTDLPAGTTPGTFSPDGKQIAYVVSQQDGHREIYAMNADGSNQRQITFLKQVVTLFWWSPDGKYLSISSNLDKNYSPMNWRTWIASLDGTTQLDVTKDAGISPVAWRP